MALTFPTPPTPPTPPAQPRVVLEGGGSVTDMPRPKSYGPTSKDALNEQKAKDAVAHGAGPLSKTTTSTPKENQQANENTDKNANANASQIVKNPRENEASPQNVQSQGEAAKTEKRIDIKEAFPQEGDTEKAQVSSTSQPFRIHNGDTGHGVFYWGFTIAAVLALLVYAARKFLIRDKTDTRGFSKRDLSTFSEEPERRENIPPVAPKSIVKNYQSQAPIAVKENKTAKQEPPKEGSRFEVRV